MKMRRLVLALALVLVLSPRARAQDALDPVAPGWLDGDKLSIELAGCSVEPPGPGWRWLAPRRVPPAGTIQVLCRSPDGATKFLFQVQDDKLGKLTDAAVLEYLTAFEKPMAAKGLRVRKIGFEPSEVPLAGRSDKYDDELEDEKGKVLHSRGYVTTAKHVYLFNMTSNAESADLQKSAASFRLLHGASEGEMSPKSLKLVLAALAGIVLLLATALVATIVVWRRRRREEETNLGKHGDL